MTGPDFTPLEAQFLVTALEGYVFGTPRLVTHPQVDVGALVAKVLELKKQAVAMSAARRRYMEVLNTEDAAHA